MLVPILALIFVAYFGVWNFDFVYDDYRHLVSNQSVHALAPITKFFTEQSTFTGVAQSFVWRPVAAFFQAVSWQIFGTQAGWYHALNLFLHLINVGLVYLLTFILAKKRRVAGLVGVLFGIHPALTEAVSWISSQNSLLFSLFFLTAAILIVKRKLFWVSCAMFLLAMFTRESAAAGTPVIFALFMWGYNFKRQAIKYSILKTLPYLAVAGGYFSARQLVNPIFSGPDYSWGTIWIVPWAFGKYLGLIFWPAKLIILDSLVRGFPVPEGVFNPLVMLGLIGALILTGLMVFAWRKKWWTEFVGFLWFGAFMLPVIQIIPWISIFGSRVLYLPFVGLAIAVLSIIWRFVEVRRVNLFAVKLVAASLIVILTTLAARRNQEWKNGETLWKSALAITPENSIAYRGLYDFYRLKGDFNIAQIWRKKLANFLIKKPEVALLKKLAEDPNDAELKIFVTGELNALYDSLGSLRQGVYGKSMIAREEESVEIYDSATNRLVGSPTLDDGGFFYFYLNPGDYYLKLNGWRRLEFTIQLGRWSQLGLDFGHEVE